MRSEFPYLRQEVYVRVYSSAERRLPEHALHLLFAVACNLIIDKRLKECVVGTDMMEGVAGLIV